MIALFEALAGFVASFFETLGSSLWRSARAAQTPKLRSSFPSWESPAKYSATRKACYHSK
jgi:hypothetical protein